MEEASGFPSDALAFFPFRARRLLTDSGSELTNRRWKRRAGGAKKARLFEALCQERGIAHRLAAPCTPRTNGMAERFNRLVKEGAVRNRRHESHDAMENPTLAWRRAYNAHRPHGGIQGRTPLQEALRRHKDRPEIFSREPTPKDVQALPTYPD